MLQISTNIQGLDKLQKQIEKVENLIKLQNNNKLNNFLKNKVWETLQNVMNQRLIGGTTNDEEIELYRSSNHIEDTTSGFILYNDAEIEVSDVIKDKYPNGKFSIALAFEYGIGIVGEGTYDKSTSSFVPWQYNINNYNFGWKYYKNGKVHSTYGYMGFEIYRYVVDEVNKNINQWVKEFYDKQEV